MEKICFSLGLDLQKVWHNNLRILAKEGIEKFAIVFIYVRLQDNSKRFTLML